VDTPGQPRHPWSRRGRQFRARSTGVESLSGYRQASAIRKNTTTDAADMLDHADEDTVQRAPVRRPGTQRRVRRWPCRRQRRTHLGRSGRFRSCHSIHETPSTASGRWPCPAFGHGHGPLRDPGNGRLPRTAPSVGLSHLSPTAAWCRHLARNHGSSRAHSVSDRSPRPTPSGTNHRWDRHPTRRIPRHRPARHREATSMPERPTEFVGVHTDSSQ
jgi:hypothetical protein